MNIVLSASIKDPGLIMLTLLPLSVYLIALSAALINSGKT